MRADRTALDALVGEEEKLIQRTKMRTDVEDAIEVQDLLSRGLLSPAPSDLQNLKATIEQDLLEPLGLKVPPIPLYVADHLLPWTTSASTKFTHDQPDHDKKPMMVALNAMHLMISSEIDTAATLAHELIHAALPYDADPVTGPYRGHGPVFEGYANRIGLVGDPRSTDPGPQFREWFKRRVKRWQ